MLDFPALDKIPKYMCPGVNFPAAVSLQSDVFLPVDYSAAAEQSRPNENSDLPSCLCLWAGENSFLIVALLLCSPPHQPATLSLKNKLCYFWVIHKTAGVSRTLH